MSVYLYNLGFSVSNQNAALGRFEPYATTQSGLAQSSCWLSYNGSGLPTGVGDNVAPLAALTASDWGFVQQDNSTMNASAGDYLIVRVFPVDSGLPTGVQLRLGVIFGRGISGPPPGPATTQLQTPLMMGTRPRAVVDTGGAMIGNPGWPVATGTDGAWTYCVGMVHGASNDYAFNTGVTTWVPSGAYNGFFAYGHDPQLHVVGMKAKQSAA